MKENCQDKEKIVLESQKLINGVLKEKNLSYMKDELYDICMIGLVRGLNTYKENKGATLKTYVINCIKTEIAKYFYINNMKKRQAKVLSYNVVVGDDGTEMIELFPDEYDLEEDILARENNKQLYAIMGTLPKKSREILCYSYGVFGYHQKSNIELAQKYGISEQAIVKIKIESKNKLKMILQNDYFTKYIEENYNRFLSGKDKKRYNREIMLESNLDFRQKEYLLKSLKRRWKEEENNCVQKNKQK